MRLADLVLPLLPQGVGRGRVIAIVGAGGKTSALFALAEELCALGCRILLTTTTKLRDPRSESGRRFDGFELAPALAPALAAAPGHGIDRSALDRIRGLSARGRILVLGSAVVPSEDKLAGIASEALCALADAFDYLLVEADGARGLPVKAPGPGEPVIPPCCDLVVGCMGLDALGKPIDHRTVHRPEILARLVGASVGQPLTPAHLAALLSSSEGLFKGAPQSAARLAVLNKADLLSAAAADAALEAIDPLLGPALQAVAVCSFASATERVRALRLASPRAQR